MPPSALSPSAQDRLRRIAVVASVTVAATLIALKLGAYALTGSVALLSSLTDSGVDLVASLITALGVATAMKPPDQEHRYGHSKAEALAALAQAAFIFAGAAFLVVQAIARLANPRPVEAVTIGLIVMAVSIVLTFVLLAVQTYAVRQTGSLAIAADRMHYVGDILINGAVIATLVLQGRTGLLWLDPLFGLAIAALLFFSARQIARSALGVLMDRELPDEDRQKIRALALSVPGAKGVHDMRTRSDGDIPIIEMHIEMDPELRLRDSHDIVEAVIARIEEAFPGADLLVHQDPAGIVERRRDEEIDCPKPSA